ncbi:ECF transporter S component [Paenibacillus hamazuiensis]|uniref:ECF transporter S component n=1 Tax=Paenibacillus hamazuiensis TaxID=2936508 RepID=UPI00200D87EE|nr:ECF transporter S component [Paenibacillus hamazuiensis]
MSKKLKLSDILVTVVIAVLFAVIYRLWGPVSEVVKLVGVQADQLVYGMWFIASTVAFLLIRKPGIALLAEAAAASGELVMGSQYGVEALTYGIMQGLGAELVFALFAYRKASLSSACLAAVGAAAGSLVMDVYKGSMADLVSWNLALYIVFRFVGSVFFTGICAYYLVKALEATGVTSLVRPASQDDYKALDFK